MLRTLILSLHHVLYHSKHWVTTTPTTRCGVAFSLPSSLVGLLLKFYLRTDLRVLAEKDSFELSAPLQGSSHSHSKISFLLEEPHFERILF